MKRMSVVLAVVLAVGLVWSPAFGQISSSKGTGVVADLSAVQYKSYAPLMWQQIKVPQSKELVFDVSLVGTLVTDTLVKSKNGKADNEMATAWIEARVFIVPLAEAIYDPETGDPDIKQMKAQNLVEYAYPKEGVTFVKRTQEMMAKFQGFYQECIEYEGENCVLWEGKDALSCLLVDEFGNVTTIDTGCELAEEELQLILTTTSANAFNFISHDVNVGEYLVVVEGEADGTISAESSDSRATAIIEKGSLVVDQARYVK